MGLEDLPPTGIVDFIIDDKTRPQSERILRTANSRSDSGFKRISPGCQLQPVLQLLAASGPADIVTTAVVARSLNIHIVIPVRPSGIAGCGICSPMVVLGFDA